MATVQTVQLALVNSVGAELDSINLNVKDPSDCSREVMAALSREKWVLSVGDRVEVRERVNDPRYTHDGSFITT